MIFLLIVSFQYILSIDLEKNDFLNTIQNLVYAESSRNDFLEITV